MVDGSVVLEVEGAGLCALYIENNLLHLHLNRDFCHSKIPIGLADFSIDLHQKITKSLSQTSIISSEMVEVMRKYFKFSIGMCARRRPPVPSSFHSD